MATVEKMFGTALTLHLRTEKAILSKYQRLPGLPSSRTGLETILGEDEEIGFADVLSGKCHLILLGSDCGLTARSFPGSLHNRPADER